MIEMHIRTSGACCEAAPTEWAGMDRLKCVKALFYNPRSVAPYGDHWGARGDLLQLDPVIPQTFALLSSIHSRGATEDSHLVRHRQVKELRGSPLTGPGELMA